MSKRKKMDVVDLDRFGMLEDFEEISEEELEALEAAEEAEEAVNPMETALSPMTDEELRKALENFPEELQKAIDEANKGWERVQPQGYPWTSGTDTITINTTEGSDVFTFDGTDDNIRWTYETDTTITTADTSESYSTNVIRPGTYSSTITYR